MGAIVERFTGAPVPEPMPIVMNDIVVVRAPRRRSLPQFIIEPRGHGSRFSVANRGALVVVPGAAKIGPANRAAVQLFYRLLQQVVAVEPVPYKAVVGGTLAKSRDPNL